MSLIKNSIKEKSLKEKLLQNSKYTVNTISFHVNNNRCNLKNKIGIITPNLTEDFEMKSFFSISKNNQKNENIEKALTNENTTNKTTSDNRALNSNQYNQYFVKNINCDYSETIVPCKPMLNSTASKIFMSKYSISKRYKEDKIVLFSSIQESEPIKVNSDKNKKFDKELSKEGQLEPEEEIDELEELLKYQETHLPVPLSKKDNETFKILTMKKMKRISMPPNKSVRKFAEDIEPKYEKEFRIHNAFSTMKKKKPVHSTRKLYFSNFILTKNDEATERFMVFRDKDIGMYEYWQAHIHEAHNDEDVETDEDQKNVARNFSISEVKEGFEYIKNNGNDAFVNFNRYGYLMGKINAKTTMENIEYKLNEFILSKQAKIK
jgi:hypothetical protein